MNNESVTTAFNLLLEELDRGQRDLKQHLQDLARGDDMHAVQDVSKAVISVRQLTERVAALRAEWQVAAAGPPSAPEAGEASEPAHGKWTELVVKLPDGTTIRETTAAQTFARAIKELGFKRVAELGKRVNGYPLVSTKRHPTYCQQLVDGHYIFTHSSTKSKKALLEEIADELNEPLKVTIVPKL